MSAPQPDLLVVAEQRRLMGTQISVHVAVPPAAETAASAAINACLTWMAEVEACLTRFAPTSELSRLNERAGAWHDASDMLFAVTALAVQAAAASGGLFDPTLLPLLEDLGYDRDFDEIAQREVRPLRQVGSAAVAGQWRGIVLDERHRRIKLPPGTRIDLGGIAKGWAADVALDRCFAAFPNVLINVGGDMRARGGPLPGGVWSIGVQDPRAIGMPEPSRHRAILTLGAGGVATSGAAERWWLRDGERQHHIVDPRTGRPAHVWVDAQDDANATNAHLIATATALAPTAAQAEVAAKVALLRGYPQALTQTDVAWREQSTYDATVALVLILGDGAVMPSAHLQTYLDQHAGGGDIWLLE